MQTRRVSLFTSILGYLDSWTDSILFWPLHNSVRLFYLHFFTPFFEWLVQWSSGIEVLELVPRHSVRSASNFKIFRSDLDYTVLIPQGLGADSVKKIKAVYKKWRDIFLFIGELEINTREEFEVRSHLKEQYRAYIEPIYLLRKWKYLEREIQNAPTAYHRNKAVKSLTRVAEQFGIPSQLVLDKNVGVLIGEFFEARLSTLKSSLPIRSTESDFTNQTFSHFLGWNISMHMPMARSLFLSKPTTLVLASLLPDGTDFLPHSKSTLMKMRHHDSLQSVCHALHAYELMVCRSVERTSSELNEGHYTWVNHLTQVVNASPHGKALLSVTPSNKLFQYGRPSA
jgi:hypothetical protein